MVIRMTDQTNTSTLLCHACGALNRVPKGRQLSQGKCGKCGSALATETPVDITGQQFERLTAKDTGAYVVDVWAPWCGPCKMMAPSYTQLAGQLKDDVRLFKLNSDDHQEAAARLGLRGVPTLIAFNEGRQTAHQAGAQTGPQLSNWVRKAVGI
tara:strand:+ start:2020 stop:2481 length:462 start_codon:yes stop_codon:yes gene_type:complete